MSNKVGAKDWIIVFVITSIILATLELMAYKHNSNDIPLFYYNSQTIPEQDAIIKDLYNILDPNLGYTFNPGYTPPQADGLKQYFFTKGRESASWLVPGFIKFKGIFDHSKTIKIACLGGSAVDSNLFQGNWPYQLHILLNRKKISHEIYNGAVSGYSSNQEIIKLIRDIRKSDNFDFIIVYDGVNDTIQNEDMVENHPFVHPYQYYSYRSIASTELTGKYIFPNIIYLIKKMFKRTIPISLGIPTTNYVDNYISNIHYMKEISTLKAKRFIHFLQPFTYDLSKIINPNTSGNKTFHFNIDVMDEQFNFLHKAEEILSSASFSVSFLHYFDDMKEKKYFYDNYHLTTVGNMIIAQEIYKEMFRKPVERRISN